MGSSSSRLFLYPGTWDAAPFRQAFAELCPKLEILSPQDALDHTLDAEFAAVWAPTREMLTGLRSLRAVFSLGAGVDHLPPWSGALSHIPVYRIEDAGMADQMVEYALLAALRAQRHWDIYSTQQRAGLWARIEPIVRANFVVGVVGLGVLGAHIATALADFGYCVRGLSRRPKDLPRVACFSGLESLPAFLAPCQLLISVLPRTAPTEGLFGHGVLSMLPDGASFVNLGRGVHLVEQDVLDLLDCEKLSHVTLDVTRDEPPPPGHPFWSHPRVSLTPHIAAISQPGPSVAQIIQKIGQIERNIPASGRVDFDHGY